MHGNPRRKSSRLSDDIQQRIQTIRDALVEKKFDPRIVDTLCKHIQKSDLTDLYRLRMKALATEWDLSYRDILETSLEATRLGLLTLSWDVLCPHCRGVRIEAKNLAEIPESANCEACDLFVSTNQKEKIELTFHVHPAIRKNKEYRLLCSGSRQQTTRSISTASPSQWRAKYRSPAASGSLLAP